MLFMPRVTRYCVALILAAVFLLAGGRAYGVPWTGSRTDLKRAAELLDEVRRTGTLPDNRRQELLELLASRDMLIRLLAEYTVGSYTAPVPQLVASLNTNVAKAFPRELEEGFIRLALFKLDLANSDNPSKTRAYEALIEENSLLRATERQPPVCCDVIVMEATKELIKLDRAKADAALERLIGDKDFCFELEARRVRMYLSNPRKASHGATGNDVYDLVVSIIDGTRVLIDGKLVWSADLPPGSSPAPQGNAPKAPGNPAPPNSPKRAPDR